jgi:hypothetical protein
LLEELLLELADELFSFELVDGVLLVEEFVGLSVTCGRYVELLRTVGLWNVWRCSVVVEKKVERRKDASSDDKVNRTKLHFLASYLALNT